MRRLAPVPDRRFPSYPGRRRLLIAGGAGTLLAGCASADPRAVGSGAVAGPDAVASDRGLRTSPDDSPLPGELRRTLAALSRPWVLALGEVHDHPGLHARRLAWLRAMVDAPLRPCLALEQFDASRQAELDAAQRRPSPEARAVAAAGGFDFAGWDWPLYEPLIGLALAHGLPLLGANLPAAEVASIARGRGSGGEPPPDWRDADEAAQRRLLDEGHCGLLPAAMLAPMARAQRARDAGMARAAVAGVARHAMPVVLIAGNGHVRRDLGVPRFLAAAGHVGAVISVGFVEQPDADGQARRDPSGLHDWRVALPALDRPDPCEALRARFGRPR